MLRPYQRSRTLTCAVAGALAVVTQALYLPAQPRPTADTSASRGAPLAQAERWTEDSLAVAQASAAWMRALQRRDTRGLDTLMATDFRLSAPSNPGDGVDKATWIRNAQTILATESAAYPAMGFRRVAPDVAVGSGLLYWRTRLRGWPVPVRHFAVTDVWVRRDGRWQIMARDADLAPQVWRWIGAVGGALGMAVVLGLVALVRRRRRRRRAALQNADRMSDVATALPAA